MAVTNGAVSATRTALEGIGAAAKSAGSVAAASGHDGTKRFGELQRLVGGASPKMLAQRLRELNTSVPCPRRCIAARGLSI